jgi:hypothetical protein
LNNLNAAGIIDAFHSSFKYIRKGNAMTQFIILFLVPFIAWEIFLYRLGHEVSVIESIRIYGILTALNLLIVKFVVWIIVKTLKVHLEPESIWCLLIAVVGAVILPFVGEIFRKYSGVRVEINARKQEERLEKKGVAHLKENEASVRMQADAPQKVGEPMPEASDDPVAPSCADDEQGSIAPGESGASAEAPKAPPADAAEAGHEEGELAAQGIIESPKAVTSGARPDEAEPPEAASARSGKAELSGEEDRKGDCADGGAVETDPKTDESAEDETTLG